MKRPRLAVLFACALLASAAQVSAATPSPGPSPYIALRYVTIFVPDADAALAWYTNVLGFVKTEDQVFGGGRRWIVVAPTATSPVGIVLDAARGGGRDRSDRVGKEANWVFRVRDCAALVTDLSRRGVTVVQPPHAQPWGTVQAIIADPYGNEFVLESTAASGVHRE